MKAAKASVTTRALAVLLSLGIAQPSFAILIRTGGGSSSAERSGPPAQAPNARPLDIPAPALAEQLTSLAPLQQIELLQERAAVDPVARDVAAMMVKPELFTLHQDDAAKLVGGAEQAAALARLTVALHVEARNDEKVLAGLHKLGQQISPQGRLDMLDVGQWFDGRDLAEASSGKLEPALVWPIEEGSAHQRRVQTLTVKNDRFLINGKLAHAIRASGGPDGSGKETLIHPSDPNLMVKVYYSAGTIEAFERKSAKIDNLTPLSLSGAAPKAIEHGETAVEGKGRVYFYVQELARGTFLRDVAPEDRPLEQVRELFTRLTQAGLSLVVPGSDNKWLLSHLIAGKTPSGGERVYLVGGTAAPATPEQAAAQYEMLLSVLTPDPGALKKAPIEKKIAAAAVPERLVARAESDDRTIIATWAPSGLGAEKVETLPSAEAAAEYAARLIANPAVTKLEVSPAVKEYVQKRSAKELYEILKIIPASDARDALIAKIPGAAFAKTESADIVSILTLIDGENVSTVFPKIAREAWRALSRADVERLVKHALAKEWKKSPAVIARVWSGSHEERWQDRGAARDFYELLRHAPASEARDEAVWKIPHSAYAQMPSADLAALLSLLSADNLPDAFKRLPASAWRALDRADLEKTLARLAAAQRKEAPGLAARLWLAEHELRGAQFAPILALAPSSAERDAAIAAIPASAFAEMTSADVAALLSLIHKGGDEQALQAHARIPEPSWLALAIADVENLVKEWNKAEYKLTAGALVKRWISAHPDFISDAASGKSLTDLVRAVSQCSAELNAAIFAVPAAAYAKMASADIARLLWTIGQEPEESAAANRKVPLEAWRALGRADVEHLIKQWSDKKYKGKYAPVFGVIAQNWARANLDKAGSALSGKDFIDIIDLITPSDERNDLIVETAAAIYPKVSGADLAALLLLVTKEGEKKEGAVYGRLPAKFWLALGRGDMEALVKPWIGVEYFATAEFLVRTWLDAHLAQFGKSGVSGADLFALINLLRDDAVDRIIPKIPASVYETMSGRDVVSIMHHWSRIEPLPAAWRRMAVADVEVLVEKWKAINADWTKRFAAHWMELNGDRLGGAGATGADLARLIERMTTQEHKDELIAKIPGTAWAKMDAEQAAAILWHTRPDKFHELPDEAWRSLSFAKVEQLTAKTDNKTWLCLLAAQWFARHGDVMAGITGADVVRLVGSFPETAQKTAIILSIPGPAFASMTSAEVRALIWGEIPADSYGKLPRQAWQTLRLLDIEAMEKMLATTEAAVHLRLLWSQARRAAAPAATGKDLYELISGLPEGPDRNEMIAKISGADFAAMESDYIKAILSLAVHNSKDESVQFLRTIPEEAWYRITRQDMTIVSSQKNVAAKTVIELWMKARQ